LLAIEVEYLLGRVYAAEFRNDKSPEWPPHPARLFSALVAAHHDTEGTELERNALLWLERQEPPQISAQQAGQPDHVVDFVPTNYAGKSGSSLPDQRTKQARSFPAQSPASPVVRFLWPGVDPPGEYVAAIKGLTARVTSLGRACSLVRAYVADMNSSLLDEAPAFIADESGKTVLAVAGEGRLDELERTYAIGRRPQQGAPVRYLDLRASELKLPAMQGHFGEMIVLRRISGIGLPILSTPLLAKRLRETFLSHAGFENEMLSGHAPDGKPATEPHLAFAALPNVGGNFGDGRLLGLAVVLPASISKPDRRRTLQACASIETLNLGELGEWKVEIANFDVSQRTLKPETWMRPSTRWATVTPILLDRYPKKGSPAEELLITACIRAGLPSPLNCFFSPFADQNEALRGVPPVFAFSLNRWGTHASFEFSAPVKGPVLVGAGRFYGMGLLKPIPKIRNQDDEQ
jgi:CRISPR-associated protein Csb2